jgi:hypothetical protein
MSDQPYQLLPPLTAEEYAALREDIAANGIRVPVDVDEDGQILDGHHRQAIAADLGIPCPTRVVAGLTEDDKRAHALAVNSHRRALTVAQRRELAAAELERDPFRSDRAIGRLVGVDHKTVGAIRRGGWGIPHDDRPVMTREEAERITQHLDQTMRDYDSGILVGLLRGVPPALMCRNAITEPWRRFESESTLDAEVMGMMRRHLVDSRVDAVLQWPHGGHYAELVASQDDKLRAVLLAQRGAS